MKEEYVIYSCLEHAELALDDFVNNEEKAPQIEKIQEENKCSYCEKAAEYKIEA